MHNPSFPHRIIAHTVALFFLASSIAVQGVAPAQAQDAAEYAVQPDSKLWIDGTSNKSDFTVNAAEVKGTFGIASSGENTSVTSGTISVESAKLEGGKSTIMDRLMHDALQVKEHPTITYVLTSAEIGDTSSDDGSVTLKTKGKLTLTGTTKDIEMDVKGSHSADGSIRFRGSYPLKMSDYGMEPPTAMFGALRTADDVTVHFDVTAAPAE